MAAQNIIEILLITVVAVILIYLFFYFIGTLLAPVSKQDFKNQVCFGQKCFFIELAKTEAERNQGLMYRKELDKNKGMLFIFDKEGSHPFWMKNTLIPLDIIWIDSRGKIVFISQNVQPCKNLVVRRFFLRLGQSMFWKSMRGYARK